jgi:hypothetical protein
LNKDTFYDKRLKPGVLVITVGNTGLDKIGYSLYIEDKENTYFMLCGS